ncbi:copper chaperone PCu(A)C [Alteromonas antoniana]|uniref:copper chaperone PCu(A)C n=1 Tax=Alteromonas antoniana TaxID=2803813 RepID=UPI001C4498D0|nr:copper chaperone PCu(A)C [Alteromonas antoniana]
MSFRQLFFTILGLSLSSLTYAKADVMIMDPYARATFPMAQSGAVYLTIENTGETERTVSAVSVAEDIASEAQIHTTDMRGDMMQMRQVTEGIVLAAGTTMSFEPGSYHIMLMGLKQGLSEGDTVPLTLTMANGETITVNAAVKAIDKEASHHHHH